MTPVDDEDAYGSVAVARYTTADAPGLLAGMGEAVRATAAQRQAEAADAYAGIADMLNLHPDEARRQLRSHLGYLERQRELLLINLSLTDHELTVTRNAMTKGGIT